MASGGSTINAPAQPRQRYEILERIDAGGMAEVFKGKSISMEGFERLVAIKRVLPNLVENKKFLGMFLDEAKLSLALNHANVVQVFDLGRAGETYFIVMEYVEGTNLKKIYDTLTGRKTRLPISQAVYILVEVCKGLAHAHQKRDLQGRHLSIVHRDVSPPNVLLSTEGEVKLTDFGLAKARSQVEVTDPGVVKGKFAYLSPEAAWGEEVDLATDLFAAGIVLWELLAGRRLFLGESDLKTLELVRKAEIPSLSAINPDVPPALEGICLKALARQKQDRYSSAQDFSRDLSEFLFSHNMRVTAYDLSSLVKQVLRLTKKEERPKSSERIKALVQEELDHIMRIEQSAERVGQADLLDAQKHAQSQDGESSPVSTVMEDPRTWDDIFGEGDPGLAAGASEKHASPLVGEEVGMASGLHGIPDLGSGVDDLPREVSDVASGVGVPIDALGERLAAEQRADTRRPKPPPLPPAARSAAAPKKKISPLLIAGTATILVLVVVLVYLLTSG